MAHISPGHSDSINFFAVAVAVVDVDGDGEAELAALDGYGWRPLRSAQLHQLGQAP
ncbi:hypothetical protein [Actinomadura coerulea]|uniref:hypothetical protein n=1 Tax=Actinomadura coerulea TaxID=46159 RepID=UPI003414E01E